MEGEFVVVSKKRGRKRKPRTSNVKQTSISTCSNSTSAFDESCYEKSLASIHKCRYGRPTRLLKSRIKELAYDNGSIVLQYKYA